MYGRAMLVSMIVLGAMAASDSKAASQTVDELLRHQNEEQQNQVDRIVRLTKPLAECVKKQAHAPGLYSSPEKADIAARAAVGLCSKEEAAYRAALFQLAMVMTDFDAASRAQQMHDQLVNTALTIIVGERRRHRAQPQAKNETSTQHFKYGCSDFVAGRMSDDALNCLSVLSTAMELVLIFQAQGGYQGAKYLHRKRPGTPPSG